MSTNEKLLTLRQLIQQKRYSEARQLLNTLNHPQRSEWLAKLDNLEFEQTIETRVVKPSETPVYESVTQTIETSAVTGSKLKRLSTTAEHPVVKLLAHFEVETPAPTQIEVVTQTTETSAVTGSKLKRLSTTSEHPVVKLLTHFESETTEGKPTLKRLTPKS
jgi:hypothetical protein